MSYNPLCLCADCQAAALITLGQSALDPQQFVERAKRHKMTDAQQQRVEKIKLRLWNTNTKGEQVL